MASSLKVGDKVILNAEYDWNGTHLCSWTKGYTFDVIQVGAQSRGPDYIVIGIGKDVTAGVHEKDLTPINNKKVKEKSKSVPKKKEPSSENIASRILNGVDTDTIGHAITGRIPKDDSKIMEVDKRYNGKTAEEILFQRAFEMREKQTAKDINKIVTADPSIVQNAYDFPKKKRVLNGVRQYNYYMDYDSDKSTDKLPVMADMPAIRKSLNIDVNGRRSLFNQYVNRYNRFKMVYGDDMLSRTFAHVFFVRPDCNIFKSGTNNTYQLVTGLENSPDFYYARRHSPELLSQLTYSTIGAKHQFMLYPSNRVRSFEVADEYITTDSYGQGCTGYKIPYGKHNVESRTADKFSCTYIDDRDLHIYHLHKLWMDYISYVYRGKAMPKKQYVQNKVIDYATCVYYILCAEDGETIIFWSKYWGVFPTKAPSSTFSYSADNPGGIQKPEFTIEYQYAWKEDFNPLSLVEFNEHGGDHKYTYIPSYQPKKLGPAYTWSGAPFIETFNSSNDVPYTFKLRFRPNPTTTIG